MLRILLFFYVLNILILLLSYNGCVNIRNSSSVAYAVCVVYEMTL